MAKVRRKHHETRIFTLNNPTAPRLCPELAIEIGLNESILLLQLEFWISISGHERDGQLWTYQSLRDIQATFPFWKSVATVKTVVDSLVAKNLIFIANHNQRSNDKTQWFAINLEEVAKLKSISVAVQNLNGVFENRTTCSESEQRYQRVPRDYTREYTE